MEDERRTTPKEGKNGSLCWKGDSYLLRFDGNNVGGISSKEKTEQRRDLPEFITTFERSRETYPTWPRRNYCSPRQCAGSQLLLQELRFELLQHPQFSLDLPTCNFYLVQNLRKWLKGKKFSGNAKVTVDVDSNFEGFDKSYNKNCILAPKNR